jgi:uncharacterized protein YndB with AHSA1/START domain
MKPIDVISAVGAVTREVKTGERDAKPVRSVVATRLYDTGIADLWDAITTPDRIGRWFGQVEGELKLGGRYQILGNASGTITECEPPKRFALTWEFGGGMSWLTVELEPRGARTQLVLEHVAPVDPHWAKFGPGAVGVGWDLGLLGLYLHLLGAGTREEGEAWAATDEGKRFMTLASEDWGRAAIAAGDDPTAAREAAANTTKFYTASP